MCVWQYDVVAMLDFPFIIVVIGLLRQCCVVARHCCAGARHGTPVLATVRRCSPVLVAVAARLRRGLSWLRRGWPRFCRGWAWLRRLVEAWLKDGRSW